MGIDWGNDERLGKKSYGSPKKDFGDSKFITIQDGVETVINVKRVYVNESPKFSPGFKDGTRQGWAIEIEDEDGRVLTCSTFGLQGAITKARVEDGDTVGITRVKRGIYLVRKIV